MLIRSLLVSCSLLSLACAMDPAGEMPVPDDVVDMGVRVRSPRPVAERVALLAIPEEGKDVSYEGRVQEILGLKNELQEFSSHHADATLRLKELAQKVEKLQKDMDEAERELGESSVLPSSEASSEGRESRTRTLRLKQRAEIEKIKTRLRAERASPPKELQLSEGEVCANIEEIRARVEKRFVTHQEKFKKIQEKLAELRREGEFHEAEIMKALAPKKEGAETIEAEPVEEPILLPISEEPLKDYAKMGAQLDAMNEELGAIEKRAAARKTENEKGCTDFAVLRAELAELSSYSSSETEDTVEIAEENVPAALPADDIQTRYFKMARDSRLSGFQRMGAIAHMEKGDRRDFSLTTLAEDKAVDMPIRKAAARVLKKNKESEGAGNFLLKQLKLEEAAPTRQKLLEEATPKGLENLKTDREKHLLLRSCFAAFKKIPLGTSERKQAAERIMKAAPAGSPYKNEGNFPLK